tara:strand:+ start:2285 stop:2605 length:321 start_codon:yes stop_codon:yes gene_type:complete
MEKLMSTLTPEAAKQKIRDGMLKQLQDFGNGKGIVIVGTMHIKKYGSPNTVGILIGKLIAKLDDANIRENGSRVTIDLGNEGLVECDFINGVTVGKERVTPVLHIT